MGDFMLLIIDSNFRASYLSEMSGSSAESGRTPMYLVLMSAIQQRLSAVQVTMYSLRSTATLQDNSLIPEQ